MCLGLESQLERSDWIDERGVRAGKRRRYGGEQRIKISFLKKERRMEPLKNTGSPERGFQLSYAHGKGAFSRATKE